MNTPALDVAALAGLFSYFTVTAMQLVKPLIELIPGLALPQNAAAHDGLLRLLLVAANFGLLALAAQTAPGTFAGWHWWDLLALAAGQSVAGHVAYRLAVAGKQDAPPPTAGAPHPPVYRPFGPRRTFAPQTDTPGGSVVSPPIPTIPR